jgi:hypothetical protein
LRLSERDLLVLALIKEQPRNAYFVWDEIRHRDIRNWLSISQRQVYYSFKKLLRKRLIETCHEYSIMAGPGRGAGTYVARILPIGVSLLLQDLEAPRWSSCKKSDEYVIWFGLAILAGLSPETRRKVEARRMASLETALQHHRGYLNAVKYEVHRVITRKYLEHRIRQLEAELSFLLS